MIRVTLLGTGSSSGVPQVGCRCKVCQSDNPKNKRLRVSALVETAGKHLLIDTSPDFRTQALAQQMTKVDAVLYTHDHADHLHGIDDLRAFNILSNAPIPIFCDFHTLNTMKNRFPYIFLPKSEEVWYRTAVIPHEIPSNPLQNFLVEGISVTPIAQQHGKAHSLGFRIDNFAYSTDVNGFPDESFAALENLDVWVVDCLRYTQSMTHARLEQVLEWAARLRPKLTVLTHMAHELDYDTLATELPAGIVPGYDGMTLTST